MNKKVLLMILDGWGKGKDSNISAIDKANTPFIDSLYKDYSNSELSASGKDVGLPDGQMGNSEVGHMNLGAGRVIFQDLVRLNEEIENNNFSKNKEFVNCIDYLKKTKKSLHLLGLLSDGGVHSHLDHLFHIIKILKKTKIENVFIHSFLDGRDTSPKKGIEFVEKLSFLIKDSKIRLATVMGRYYSMDRDMRWDRIKLAYDAMVVGKGIQSYDLHDSIKKSYEKNVFDEFILPTVYMENNKPICKIDDGDVVFTYNFRSDRMRQLTSVLTQKDYINYKMKKKKLYFLTMTNYDEEFKNINILYNKPNIKNTLGEILSKNNKNQLRIAETEKYPHVTYFFSGGKEKKFFNEERILCPSPKVSTYDLKPEMSAFDVEKQIIKPLELDYYDFICLNLANPDMVGHTGDFDATVKACEVIDKCSKKIINKAVRFNYKIILIADHGNADIMINKDGSPHTYHTTNPVPFILIDKNFKSKLKNGILADVAPTILDIMDIEAPKEMTGKSLI
ncbi:MAG: phosphoglycerate mutase (2,3-diphosphoglycerate-independent) [Legionellales bacterium]|nr:phosphoglycerate mutase (2,3-diphosphoglycerate-independent) [Legionellales bacterium]